MCIPLPKKSITLMRFSDHGLALFLYILLVAVFYSPVVFAGRSLIPSLYQPHGVVPEGVYDRTGRTPVNSFNVDLATPAYYEFPINRLVGDIYRRGSIPLWNPYQAAGSPLAAQYSTRAFFPYQIIEDISPYWLWDFFMLGRLVIAGLFTYLLLSSLGLGFTPALAGGMFYMLSGSFVWFINLEQYANAAMTTPVLMYLMERLVSAKVKGPGLRLEVALSGAGFALLFLAGQPEAALYAATLAASYFYFRAFSLYGIKGFIVGLFRYVPAYAIGLGLSAFLLIPFLEFVGLSFHIHPQGGPIGVERLANWKAVFAMLTPGATEFPTNPDMMLGVKLSASSAAGEFFRAMPINGVWDTLGGYTGVLPLFMIVSGLMLSISLKDKRTRGPLLFFTFFGSVILLKNLGVLPFLWLGRLPLFDRVWSLRWAGPSWVFAFSAAAAFGLEAMESALARGDVTKVTVSRAVSGIESIAGAPRRAFQLAFSLIAGVYLLSSFFPVAASTLGRTEAFNPIMRPFAVPAFFSSSVVTVIVMLAGFLLFFFKEGEPGSRIFAVILLGALELWWAVPRGYDAGFLLYKWPLFFIGIVTVFMGFKGSYRGAFFFCLVFFAAGLALDAYSPRGFPHREDPFKEAPYAAYLRRGDGLYRSTGLHGALFPNSASALGIRDLHYVNSLLPSAYHQFRAERLHADAIEEGTESALWFTGRPERSALIRGENGGLKYMPLTRAVSEDVVKNLENYSLLSVRYFIMPSGREADAGLIGEYERLIKAGLRPVYEAEVRILENPGALKRVFMVPGGLRLSSPGSGNEAYAREGALVDISIAPSQAAQTGLDVEVREDSPNRVEINASSDRDGLLVLTDSYFHGWKASINGMPSPILRVNGILRGVLIKKGRSVVVFDYFPVSFKAGLLVSAISALACVALIFTSCLRRGM